jgi:hypothetical protein
MTLSTVIAGPPERSRTRSPGSNELTPCRWITGFGIVELDGVSEKAGRGKVMLSAIPSSSAFAIDVWFANADMFNSFSRSPRIGSQVINTNKLQFRNGGVGRDDHATVPLLRSTFKAKSEF